MTSDDLTKHWLNEQYLERKRTRGSYSLRQFAHLLGISPGRLSEYLSGKRRITRKAMERLLSRLDSSGEERTRLLAYSEKGGSAEIEEKLVLSEYQFALVADWYYFAILSLIETPDFESDASFIAKRLGISLVEVHQALEGLTHLGLIHREDGRIKRKVKKVFTTTDIPSKALRKAYKQTLEHATECLDLYTVEEREIGATTLRFDPKRLPEIKQEIRKMRRKIAKLCEATPGTEVYEFTTAFVPLTKVGKTKKGESH